MSVHKSAPVTPPKDLDETTLREQIHALIHNLVSGQAGIEPLLYPDEEAYVMKIEALFKAWSDQRTLAELEFIYHYVGHYPGWKPIDTTRKFVSKLLNERIKALEADGGGDDQHYIYS